MVKALWLPPMSYICIVWIAWLEATRPLGETSVRTIHLRVKNCELSNHSTGKPVSPVKQVEFRDDSQCCSFVTAQLGRVTSFAIKVQQMKFSPQKEDLMFLRPTNNAKHLDKPDEDWWVTHPWMRKIDAISFHGSRLCPHYWMYIKPHMTWIGWSVPLCQRTKDLRVKNLCSHCDCGHSVHESCHNFMQRSW